MSDSSAHVGANDAKNNPSQGQDKLDEIRNMLFGPELKQLDKMQKRLDNLKFHAEALSKILPEAIVLRASQDKQLIKALMPTVEEAVETSVKKDPMPLVDALFPVMGPAIRKAVAETFKSMIQSLNQTLEHVFSWQGFKWRLEALHARLPFSEVVLLRSLIYQVEQVFLIHKETGLLLQHAVAESVAVKDGDIVSGMLTAIQDFVRDSFSVQDGDALETMQVGELTVWIEQGPQAILAGVIRGNAPEELRLVFRDALESICLEQSDALISFDGDSAPFKASREHLETWLQAQYGSQKRKTSPFLWILLGTILIALGLWGFFSIRNNRRWASYLDKLKAESGIVVTAAKKRHGKYFISGLRDPLAAEPTEILKGTKLNPKKIVCELEPYQALNPEFILIRAVALLVPPETVTLNVENGVLHATGTASHRWIVETKKLVRAIPGITQFQEDNLVDKDLKELVLSRERIEGQILRFVRDTALFVPNQDDMLQNLVAEIQKLSNSAKNVGKEVLIEVVGHADSEGLESANMRLSQKRAKRVLHALVAKGLRTPQITAIGVGTKEPLCEELTEEGKEFNRSVSFRVILAGSVKSP